MLAAASAAAGALFPEVGRGLSTGLALYAANQGQQCPACTCAPQLQCPELRCDCSGLQGSSTQGPGPWSVALACAASGLVGACSAALACWRLSGRSFGPRGAAPATDGEADFGGAGAGPGPAVPMAAPAPPAYPSVAGFGVQPGDFIGVQYNIGGAALIHERLVVLMPPGRPDSASILTLDDDEYEEKYVGSADVLRWDIFPGRCWRRDAVGPGGPIVANAGGRALDVPAAAPLGALVPPAVRPAAPAAGVAGMVAALGGPAAAPGASLPLLPPAAALPGGAHPPAPAPAPMLALAAPPPGTAAAAPAPAALADVRVHPVVYKALGSRRIGFGDAVERTVEHQWPDWPISGPRTTLWVCQFMKDNGLSPLGRHSKWRSEGRLALTDGGVAEHERCCSYLEQMVCFDQLNVPDVAAAEMICRSIQVQEETWRERFVSSADESLDSHLFYGTSTNRGNVCVHPQLLAHVGAELSKEYAVAKERRNAREERQSARAPGNRDNEGDKGKDKDESKG
ncbi:unnamed protein product [Prorocentrum cordatum]|uniref:Uncharacterized protein n=1 Tax=Prorocentrum cordatum TaxID=2364126 RepID=A0ABN9VEV1_9DINO|nr:unnamed protein product [Polarella glacialis]